MVGEDGLVGEVAVDGLVGPVVEDGAPVGAEDLASVEGALVVPPLVPLVPPLDPLKPLL